MEFIMKDSTNSLYWYLIQNKNQITLKPITDFEMKMGNNINRVNVNEIST